jgi:alkylation response protein AidB-like acyl-CoA dehydrogenase
VSADTAGLAELHDDLRAVARDALARTSPLVAGGDPTPVDPAVLAGTGWLGLEVPEDLGGAGATFAETAVVLEELGRAAAASPYLGAVLAVGALRLVDPSPARDELLAAIAAGETTAALALPTGADEGVAGRPPFRVDRGGGDGRAVGRATFVPDAGDADRVLLVAQDPAAGPVLVDVAPGAGVVVEPTPVVDPTRSFAEVAAGGAAVPADRCWQFAEDPGRLLARGALAVALDSLGLGEAALDATVTYASVRTQFGRPIGSFQAVKHACADTRVELALARQLVLRAVDAIAGGGSGAGDAVSMAKAYATEAAVAAAGRAVQLHGGIGYTWEHGIHAYLKRTVLNRSLFGSPAAHRARLARRYGAR